MQSQAFITNYKCECYEKEFCNCKRRHAANKMFMENIYDVADALTEIMGICGIHPCKAKASVDVIIHSFLHYDEIRHRIDAVPRKRLCKEDLIHDLGRKCLMNRMEAQLTYSIIKRAFKAFYHGTVDGGLRNPVLEAQLVHSQECMWVHAAKRTAQIFASYEGMFFSAQKQYESQIKCVYKRLYDHLKLRASTEQSTPDCNCHSCLQCVVLQSSRTAGKRHTSVNFQERKFAQLDTDSVNAEGNSMVANVSVDGEAGRNDSRETTADEEEMLGSQRSGSKLSLKLSRCFKCDCPKLICDCDVVCDTGVLTSDCSQGPFKCQWTRIDEDEDEAHSGTPCTDIPESHVCPVDCDEASISCDPECECICDDNCECIVEDNSSNYGETLSLEANNEEEHEIELDPTDISFGGCCVLNHIVEEVPLTANPTSIAKVIGHKREASIKSEVARTTKPINPINRISPTNPINSIKTINPTNKMPTSTKAAPETHADDHNIIDNDELTKLIGQLF